MNKIETNNSSDQNNFLDELKKLVPTINRELAGKKMEVQCSWLENEIMHLHKGLQQNLRNDPQYSGHYLTQELSLADLLANRHRFAARIQDPAVPLVVIWHAKILRHLAAYNNKNLLVVNIRQTGKLPGRAAKIFPNEYFKTPEAAVTYCRQIRREIRQHDRGRS